jgi:hypothetical protein
MASKVDISIKDLVEMIRSGQLRLPEMQRRYVWRATRVRDLLDSLYRGYPSGSILVWETDQAMPTVDMAVAQTSSPFAGHKLLLDGQQRATSLSAILRGEPVVVRGVKKPIEILFNLDHPEGLSQITEVDDDAPDDSDGADEDDDEEAENDGQDAGMQIQQRLRQRTFIVASKALLADPRWIRVSDVFRNDTSDMKILSGILESFKDPRADKYLRRLAQLRKIGDYTYVMHVLDKSLSYEEVAEIFVRVNSLGVKLRSSDLALAQITSRWRDSLRLFESFQRQCQERGFTLDLGLIVRALVVFATHQSRFKTAGSIPIDKLKAAWETTCRALRWAIEFLRHNADIEDEVLLSSPFLMIAVAYFGESQKYVLTSADATELRKWLYIANSRGHYSGSSETFLDADIGAMRRGEGVQGLLTLLLRQVGRFELHAADLVGRGWRSPLFATTFLALRARGAKDLFTLGKLALSERGQHQFVNARLLFQKGLLEKLPGESRRKAEIEELANVLLLNSNKKGATAPDKLFAEVMKGQGVAALKAHCIPLDPELWRAENFGRFLEHRRILLAEAINDLILGRSAPAPGLDLAALIGGGETDAVEFKEKALHVTEPGKSKPHLLIREVAAFANSRGGVVLIGVRDDGQVVGIQDEIAHTTKGRDGYQQQLYDRIKADIGEAAASEVHMRFVEHDGVELCVVQVPRSPMPVYVKFDGQQLLFVRLGNQCKALDAKQAHDYTAKHWPS